MRINVYPQELTNEVVPVSKDIKGVAGIEERHAVRLILKSAIELPDNAEDDDCRSAITFWVPSTAAECFGMEEAFSQIAATFASHGNELLEEEMS